MKAISQRNLSCLRPNLLNNQNFYADAITKFIHEIVFPVIDSEKKCISLYYICLIGYSYARHC